MLRPTTWLPIIALASLCGCQQGPGVGVDPFGRTTIPPPGTGTASISTAVDPYYSNVPSAAPALVPIDRGTNTVSTTPSNLPAPPRTAAPAGTHWVPSGQVSSADGSHRLQPVPEFESRGTTSGRMASSSNQTSNNATIAPAAYQQPIVTAQPRQTVSSSLRWTGSGPAGASGAQPSASSVSQGRAPAIDLASLPPARNATLGNSVGTISAGTPFRGTPVISRREPTRETYIGTSDSARYGHAEDYTWLRGRLEYYASQRQWKLRYIPIDGQTDDYGGSVVLSATAALEDFQAGDYVMVNGRLGDQDADARDFAATYIASRISAVD